MAILLPLLMALIGMLVYAMASNGKVAEMGRICFAMGLLAFLLQAGPKVIGLLR